MTKYEMAKNVAKTWAEFELLDDNSEVELKMTPAAAPKKNILSYLLPMGGGVKKLKVGFVYEKHRRIQSGVIHMSLEDSILMIHLVTR